MKRTITLFLLISVVVPFRATAMGAARAPVFPVGIATRRFVPHVPSYDWRGARTHTLLTTIWYPALAGSVEQQQWVGPPNAPVASAEMAAPDAESAASPTRFPIILLSHGTGGSALMMGWLGARLAANGYIAAAVNHPGNNALEPYTTRGFMEWSERAIDLSRVLDAMLEDPKFGPRIDRGRIGAAGFSLGGFTMIELAGGIGTIDTFREFCRSPRADAMCTAPPEFPHLLAWSVASYLFSRSFRASIAKSHSSHRDSRVRAVFAIAPALGPAFAPETLEKISVPVEIVAGAADPIVPVSSSASYLANNIPHAQLTLYPGGVGHYTFLGTCTAHGKAVLPSALCHDASGVDRAAIHEETAQKAVDFFNQQLNFMPPGTR
jgi:predicted dienelactone hydrolase